MAEILDYLTRETQPSRRWDSLWEHSRGHLNTQCASSNELYAYLAASVVSQPLACGQRHAACQTIRAFCAGIRERRNHLIVIDVELICPRSVVSIAYIRVDLRLHDGPHEMTAYAT